MKGFFACSTACISLATLLPLAPSSFRLIRILDFPVIQLAAWTSVTLAALVLRRGPWPRSRTVLASVLGLCLALQGSCLLPYLPFTREQVKRAGRNRDPRNDLALLIANVLMTNRQSGALKELVRKADPDVILLTEPDAWWDRELRELSAAYPHQVRIPQENTYGMMLLSRLPIAEHAVHNLIHRDVPSIRARLELKSGRTVELFCVHPRPPSEADTRYRDAELLLAARKMKGSPHPGIVAGDLNDVAWSHTTRLFQKESGMLDPRVGRGFYNTFHARYPVLRYPLDHVFHGEDFALVDLKRLPSPGSDHFPILVTLNLHAEAAGKQKPIPKDGGDHREVEEKLREGGGG